MGVVRLGCGIPWSGVLFDRLSYSQSVIRCSLSVLFSRRSMKMSSHCIAAATLGLTQPSGLDFPKINLAAKSVEAVEWKGDMLAIGVTEKDMTKDGELKFENLTLRKIDDVMGGLLGEASGEEDFSGRSGQSLFLRLTTGLGSKRVGLVGLGKHSCLSAATHKKFGEFASTAARGVHAKSVAIFLASSEEIDTGLKISAAAAIASGALLGIYEDNRFKSESKKVVVTTAIDILGLGTGPDIERKLNYSESICSGVVLGKELANSPANVLTPGALAEEAIKVASVYKETISAKVMDLEECKKMKMGSYLGVAAASANPPYFIHLCYKPPTGPVKLKLGLVGKGLTFDSGGYNIKTGAGCSIESMKFDMCGSAAVLGAAKAIGEIKPTGVEVHFVIAACENMISGTGMRPGDIITASNGKTIEVNNTDAEGRLTLADALVYTCRLGAHKIIDLATLTGACVVALGPSIAGVFTPSEELAEEVLSAAKRSGEKLWRMPLEESYWESMKSVVADMVNTGGRHGGAITAALFLKQFVDEKVEWMHIDLAGPVKNDKGKPTGFGVHTLVEWIMANSST